MQHLCNYTELCNKYAFSLCKIKNVFYHPLIHILQNADIFNQNYSK